MTQKYGPCLERSQLFDLDVSTQFLTDYWGESKKCGTSPFTSKVIDFTTNSLLQRIY